MTTITAIRYFKKNGEFVITERNTITGKTSKTYATNLTDNERKWAKSSKDCFETETCVCWMN